MCIALVLLDDLKRLFTTYFFNKILSASEEKWKKKVPPKYALHRDSNQGHGVCLKSKRVTCARVLKTHEAFCSHCPFLFILHSLYRHFDIVSPEEVCVPLLCEIIPAQAFSIAR